MLEYEAKMDYKRHVTNVGGKTFIQTIGKFSNDGIKVEMFSRQIFINMEYVVQLETYVSRNVEYLTIIITDSYPYRRYIVEVIK